MPQETDRLKLPLPLGNENVTRESINGIFEKIDAGVATKADLDTLREAVSKMDIPDASLTQKGKVQLSDAINSTVKDKAATPSAVKLAFDEATAAKQLGVEQKNNVVAALNSIGVSASTSETWAQLIQKMAGVIRATGNATAAQVLSGATFSNASANGLTGTIANRGAGGTVMPGTVNQIKAAGYYNSEITIMGDPNLRSEIILEGNSIFNVAGSYVPVKLTELNSTLGRTGTTTTAYDSLITDVPKNKFTIVTDPVYMVLSASTGRYEDNSTQSYLCLVDAKGNWVALDANVSAAYSGGINQRWVYVTTIAIDAHNRRFRSTMFSQSDLKTTIGSWRGIPTNMDMDTLKLVHRAYVLGNNSYEGYSTITFNNTFVFSF
ncbi:tail fiber protein [Paenibacillus xylanilyticus]|uniref:tail fiber protein n=1 Tax=Paenibacillus xylanilyticus TaxID=248903 RepID=UPI0039A0BC6B